MNLSTADTLAFHALQSSMAANAAFFAGVARYLCHAPRFITPAIMQELTEACHLPGPAAFGALLAAALGWEEDMDAQTDCLLRDYIPRAVRALSPDTYRNDPYYRQIKVPSKQCGSWQFTMQTYAPYEGFVAGPLQIDTRTFRTVPVIGYFAEPFSFPSVMQNGVEWMAIKPNEIETMRAPLARANGRVLTMGLGMGYYAYMAASKKEVTSVTVIEKDPAVIELFCAELLPQFSCREKIHLLCGDALAYAETELPGAHYDTVFADLWHDAGDGLPLYLRLRGIEGKGNLPRFDYWVEDMLLSHFRALVFEKILSGEIDLPDMTAIRRTLSHAGLRQLTLGWGLT